jgi:hypothetical protein
MNNENGLCESTDVVRGWVRMCPVEGQGMKPCCGQEEDEGELWVVVRKL